MKIRTLITALALIGAWIASAALAGAWLVLIQMKTAIPVDELNRRRAEFRRIIAEARGARFGSPQLYHASIAASRALFGVTPPHVEPIGRLIADEFTRRLQAEPQVPDDVAGGAPSLAIEQIAAEANWGRDAQFLVNVSDLARRKEGSVPMNAGESPWAIPLDDDGDLNDIPEHLQEAAREAYHRIQRDGSGQ